MERVDERIRYIVAALEHTRAAQAALRDYEAALGDDGLIHSILEYLDGGLQSLRGSLAVLQGSGGANPNPAATDVFNIRIRVPGDADIDVGPLPELLGDPPDRD